MRRLKTVRRPPIYPKSPGHLPCSSLTHPLPLPSRRPSVSFGGFGLSLPGSTGWRRYRLALAVTGLVVVAAAAVGGVFAATGGGGSDDAAPLAAASPTSTPEPPILTPSPAPTTAPVEIPPVVATAAPTSLPTRTATPLAAPPVVPTATPTPASAPTATVPVLVPTPSPLPRATPTLGPTPTPTPTPVPQQPRLLHWWPGDGNANDVVGGNDGALLVGATYAQGQVGQAFSFPQSGEHVEILSGNDDFNFGPNQPMTIAMWVKRSSPPGPLPPGPIMHLLGKRTQCGGDSDIHYQMYERSDGIGFQSAGGIIVAARPDLIPFDQWHHLAVTFNGSVFKFYIEGVLRGGPSPGTFQSPNDAPLIIGGSGGCETFGGLIDEVAIYNYALSEEEVQEIYDGRDLAYMIHMHLGEAGEREEVSLETGESVQLVADVRDPDENRVGSPLVAWQLAPDVGTIDEFGIFTAGTIAGSFSSGIQVNVVHEGERASAILDVIVEPGPLAGIEIEPSEVVVQQGDTAALTARAVDEYGNSIDGVLFLWEGEDGISLDQTGKVIAGEQGGRYEVLAQASFKGGQQTASATVSVPPVWIPASAMLEGRKEHTTTLLANGKILVVGGPSSTELYDPVARAFESIGTTICNHGSRLTANAMADGRVLLVGGVGNPRCAEIYDPETGDFSRVGNLVADHWDHASALLGDGRVLIAGGFKSQNNSFMSHTVAEIYDPETESFSETGSLNLDRAVHRAALLPGGQVLIIGGNQRKPGEFIGCMGAPELFDPTTGTFRAVAGYPSSDCSATPTLLSNGNVLITSEQRGAHLFDPQTGTFRTTGAMMEERGAHAATLLPTGEVLITGGYRPGTIGGD